MDQDPFSDLLRGEEEPLLSHRSLLPDRQCGRYPDVALPCQIGVRHGIPNSAGGALLGLPASSRKPGVDTFEDLSPEMIFHLFPVFLNQGEGVGICPLHPHVPIGQEGGNVQGGEELIEWGSS